MSDRRQTWTEAMDARLATLWAEGHTAGVIAQEFRRSRNAVIGRVHRLHLPPRPSPIAGHIPALPKPTAPKVALRPVIVAPVVVPPPPPPAQHSVRLCQYPHGDPGEPGFHYCEAPVRGYGPYCPTHHALCWTGRARAA